MRVKTKLSLVGLSVGVLLIAGLFYWANNDNTPIVAPESPAGASRVPQTSAPTAPPASAATSPSPPPVAAQPSPATGPTAPPPSAATSPSPPPVAAQPSPATPPTTSPPSAAASPSSPPAAAQPGPATGPTSTATSAPQVISMPAEADMSEANRRQIQEALDRLDYYQGQVDGIFGPLTRAAIRRFQHDVGAEPTGHLTAEEANRLAGTH